MLLGGMNIKLTNGTENWMFEDGGATYSLQAAPTQSRRTVGEIAAEGGSVQGNVIWRKVELWKIAKGVTRLEKEQTLSKDYYDEHFNGEAYRAAVREGFEVLPGGEDAAKLLIKHKFAAEA